MNGQPNDAGKKKKLKFGFQNFAKLIIKRQSQKKSDTIIIIYGLPRSGKTVLGFRILLAYLKLMRMLGPDVWEVPNRWKELFSKYFSNDAEDMLNKIRDNPERSFVFVDEGIDVISWHDQMSKEQQDLVELLQKCGKRRDLMIIITPSLGLLTKPILARAHYMFIVPEEPDREGNYAYLLRNYKNPILAENFPFGLKKIVDDILKNPQMAEKRKFQTYLVSKDRFMCRIRYHDMDQKLYSLYEKIVKDPGIMKRKRKRKAISWKIHFKLQYALDTLLYRLKNSDGKTVPQIRSLMIDKFGRTLATSELIRDHISRLDAMEKPPEITDEEILDKEPMGAPEDMSLDETEPVEESETFEEEKYVDDREAE